MVVFYGVVTTTLATVFLILGLLTHQQGRTVFGPMVGADFAAFYAAGTIVNQYGPGRLYDLPLQLGEYHRMFPRLARDEQLFYAHAPYLAIGLRWLARLPYELAYLVWIGVSVALLLAGFTLLWRTRRGIPERDWLPSLLLVMAAEPFLIECCAGGQAAALGFFAISAMMAALRSGRPVWAGLALALCAYKPSLLLLCVPALALGRQWRTVGGFVAGVIALAAVSWLALGPKACTDWVRLMMSYTRLATSQAAEYRFFKYIDIISFGRLLWPRGSLAIAAVAAAVSLLWWAAAWLKAARDSEARLRAWCATLLWSSVFNLYVPVYDVLFAVPGLVIMTDLTWPPPKAWRRLLLAAVVVQWISQALALWFGLQPLTLVLWAMGAYCLWNLRAAPPSSPEPSCA